MRLSDGRVVHVVEFYCGAQYPDGPPVAAGLTEEARNAIAAVDHLSRLSGPRGSGRIRGRLRAMLGPTDARGGRAPVSMPTYGRQRVSAKALARIERLLRRGRMSPSARLDLLRRHRLSPIVCWCGGWLRRRDVE